MPIFCTQNYIISTSLCISMERRIIEEKDIVCYGQAISYLSDLIKEGIRPSDLRAFLKRNTRFFGNTDDYLSEMLGNGIFIPYRGKVYDYINFRIAAEKDDLQRMVNRR